MARQARIVVKDTLHHITQRGNRGDFIFLKKEDYSVYLDILQEQCTRFNVQIFGYCLIPNQVHLLVKSSQEELMARAIGEAHRRYTNHINARENWQGHLFQNRFFSYACDGQYGLRAIRFIETLPVTLKLTPQPEKYLWSSAKARIKVTPQASFVKQYETFQSIENWQDFLSRPMDNNEMNQIQIHLQTGRPRGSNLFLDSIEAKIGHSVRQQKRGRKPKASKKVA